MRKKMTLISFLSILLMCSACVDFSVITLSGTVESENPQICIAITNTSGGYGSPGKFTQDDGSEVEIVFSVFHGNFTIYENKEFNENGMPGLNTPILYNGKYRQKGDTVILYVDDGTEIILKKVSELPTETSETS